MPSLLGSKPNQVSTNGELGTMAFQDASNVLVGNINATGVTTVQAGTASAPAITTTGDTNTGVFFPAADTIAFAEGGAECARFDSSGNLLINTTATPSHGVRGIAVNTTQNASTLQLGNNSGGSPGGSLLYASSGNEFSVYTYTGAVGSETYTERTRVDSIGNFLFNSGYGSVATAYGCRAWVNFNGTDTVAIRASGNVSSITDNGTGDYTVNMTTAMPDANYAITMTIGGTNNAYLWRDYSDGTARTTSAFRVATLQLNQSSVDPSQVNISVFR